MYNNIVQHRYYIISLILYNSTILCDTKVVSYSIVLEQIELSVLTCSVPERHMCFRRDTEGVSVSGERESCKVGVVEHKKCFAVVRGGCGEVGRVNNVEQCVFVL